MDENLFQLAYSKALSEYGNFNTGPISSPMGAQTTILDQQIGGLPSVIALILYGSLDCANSVFSFQAIKNGINQTLFTASPYELDYVGDYNCTTAPKMLKFSDIDKVYSWSFDIQPVYAGIDRLKITMTTPPPTLDPFINEFQYTVFLISASDGFTNMNNYLNGTVASSSTPPQGQTISSNLSELWNDAKQVILNGNSTY